MSEAALLDSVLGLPVHLMDDYISWLRSRLKQEIGTHVITLNAEMTIQAEQHTALAQAIQQAELVIPDGAGIVLYMLLRGKRIQRCPGIELAELLLESIGQTPTPYPIFFYGGAPGVAAQAAKNWQQQSPHLQIAGTEHGYLSATEVERLKQTLQKLQPRLILVGLGVPRQELWIAQNRYLCPQATWIGVGGSFDIWAGTKSRAPAWLGNNHLEWLYRLYQEPWRWRRMSALPKFAGKALVSRLTQT
ncbi:WecB/TagA/CpsF family glycosyltransferase [Gloeocapsopsis dulcis]|uniref:Glycosyltransferase n=1 Tax=Gloeocapsopsis dulcis AAB1 = 1H9 TaxID=1433147 RepID=A0A6N8FTT1_9CHRO|nr:WecB/TagA/CpsF family glycosyltransferase [Gloeocapsopsis dulcis]MUL36530.1 glycosyltransferase [Gloeocapsopsis dulcis AAB1 = 1H9]WNN87815.1 WecB/TagA/CpsF family glycosyltransferase [Gloeocapsopsis dulcis]